MPENLDVLLINPPREIPQRPDFPPLGLSYLAAVLKRHNFHTKVLDASIFSWKRLEKLLKSYHPLIVGIPCWTIERGQTFKLTKLVKTLHPTTKIIIGGHHATAFPEHIFKLAEVDAVVLGEGELSIVGLVQALLEDNNLNVINGIAYSENGKVIFTEPRELIADLDSLPFPCYDDVNLDEYTALPETKGRGAAIITSRGCPHQCIYCSSSKFWKRKWRYRSPTNVLDEIIWLYEDYGVRNFSFFDDNFTVNKQRAIEICQGILDKNIQIKWVAESHVTHINRELLGWMKRSGCFRIDFGVESGSSKILKNIKKNQTVEQIEEAFRLTHEFGIKSRAYLIVGNPGEDAKTVQETVELMKRIDPYDSIGSQILWVLPDTGIYELAKAHGIISDDFWLHSDSVKYFTAEHTKHDLESLRDQLMKGMAKNEGTVMANLTYLAKKIYYKYPFFQKLRKWRGKLLDVHCP